MAGFMNGLAIIIFLSQIAQFKYLDQEGVVHWLPLAQLFPALAIAVAAIGIIVLLPRLTKKIPSPLVAIVLLTCIAEIARLPLRRIGDIAVLNAALPRFHIPRIVGSWAGLSEVLPYSAAMAAVGSIESLLTLSMLDQLQKKLSSPRKELLVQGVANLCSGFFSGMGGCAMTGQTRLNLESGGTTRISGFTASLLLIVFVLFASPLVQRIPLAALSGVMFMIAFNTFHWDSLRSDSFQPLRHTMIMTGVTLISVVSENLALGVIAGVAASAISRGNTSCTCKK
jgi:SulP family sulfate permease